MATFTVRSTVCPQCRKRIRRGLRRFGPAQVRCGHCDALVQTGLDSWAQLPTGRKIIAALGEIIAPSWMGLSGCDAVFLIPLMQVFLWLMVALPLALIGFAISSNSPVGFLIGLLVYPALLVWRLVKMIRESNAYTQTSTPPVWK
jgi:hypothetical protein